MDCAGAIEFDKTRHTLLMPDLFPAHMELLADALRGGGFRVEVLHNNGRAVLETGLKYIHNDMCYPAICSEGQLLDALLSGAYDPERVALLQFQTGGGCRASNYGMLLKKALQRLGLERVPVVSLSFSLRGSLLASPGMIRRALAALTYGDMLMLLRNQVRPYEARAGETDALYAAWQKRVGEEIRASAVTLRRVRQQLGEMARDFAAVRRSARRCVKVGVVGEVYVKYSPLANNHLEDFLAGQGCEYMLPGVLGFIHYCMSHLAADRVLYGGSRLKQGFGLTAEALLERYETALSRALKDFPQFSAPAPFVKMRENGEKLLPRGVKMGEGWYLPAEMVELIEHGYSNILCAQPFGCLPNHIVGKGILRAFRALYPEANVCAIDYDASSSPVNQENRIKLMLAMAGEPRPERPAATREAPAAEAFRVGKAALAAR